jgi:rubrerythrin
LSLNLLRDITWQCHVRHVTINTFKFRMFKQESFKMRYVKKHLDDWLKASLDLEKQANISFQGIRSYLPNYESKLDHTTKQNIVEMCRKYF